MLESAGVASNLASPFIPWTSATDATPRTCARALTSKQISHEQHRPLGCILTSLALVGSLSGVTLTSCWTAMPAPTLAAGASEAFRGRALALAIASSLMDARTSWSRVTLKLASDAAPAAAPAGDFPPSELPREEERCSEASMKVAVFLTLRARGAEWGWAFEASVREDDEPVGQGVS